MTAAFFGGEFASQVNTLVLPFIASSKGHAADVPFARLFLIGERMSLGCVIVEGACCLCV